MRHRAIAFVSASAMLIALISTGAAPASAQPTAVTTEWGQPDLRGIWDFRTITPLERPEELGDKAFLTEEEAATAEARAIPSRVAAGPLAGSARPGVPRRIRAGRRDGRAARTGRRAPRTDTSDPG